LDANYPDKWVSFECKSTSDVLNGFGFAMLKVIPVAIRKLGSFLHAFKYIPD
jgi:hypothetical protein